jgi:hypothetical protein
MKLLSRIWWLFTLVPSVLYIVSYFLTVEANVEKVAQTAETVAHYRVGGKVAESLYAPLNFLDRQIRTTYWRVR